MKIRDMEDNIHNFVNYISNHNQPMWVQEALDFPGSLPLALPPSANCIFAEENEPKQIW